MLRISVPKQLGKQVWWERLHFQKSGHLPKPTNVEDVVIIIGAEGSMLTIYSLQELEARRSDYPDESAVPAPLRMQHVLTAKLRKLVASGEWSTDLEGSCDKLHQTAVNELTQMKIPFNKDRWKFVPGRCPFGLVERDEDTREEHTEVLQCPVVTTCDGLLAFWHAPKQLELGLYQAKSEESWLSDMQGSFTPQQLQEMDENHESFFFCSVAAPRLGLLTERCKRLQATHHAYIEDGQVHIVRFRVRVMSLQTRLVAALIGTLVHADPQGAAVNLDNLTLHSAYDNLKLCGGSCLTGLGSLGLEPDATLLLIANWQGSGMDLMEQPTSVRRRGAVVESEDFERLGDIQHIIPMGIDEKILSVSPLPPTDPKKDLLHYLYKAVVQELPDMVKESIQWWQPGAEESSSNHQHVLLDASKEEYTSFLADKLSNANSMRQERWESLSKEQQHALLQQHPQIGELIAKIKQSPPNRILVFFKKYMPQQDKEWLDSVAEAAAQLDSLLPAANAGQISTTAAGAAPHDTEGQPSLTPAIDDVIMMDSSPTAGSSRQLSSVSAGPQGTAAAMPVSAAGSSSVRAAEARDRRHKTSPPSLPAKGRQRTSAGAVRTRDEGTTAAVGSSAAAAAGSSAAAAAGSSAAAAAGSSVAAGVGDAAGEGASGSIAALALGMAAGVAVMNASTAAVGAAGAATAGSSSLTAIAAALAPVVLHARLFLAKGKTLVNSMLGKMAQHQQEQHIDLDSPEQRLRLQQFKIFSEQCWQLVLEMVVQGCLKFWFIRKDSGSNTTLSTHEGYMRDDKEYTWGIAMWLNEGGLLSQEEWDSGEQRLKEILRSCDVKAGQWDAEYNSPGIIFTSKYVTQLNNNIRKCKAVGIGCGGPCRSKDIETLKVFMKAAFQVNVLMLLLWHSQPSTRQRHPALAAFADQHKLDPAQLAQTDTSVNRGGLMLGLAAAALSDKKPNEPAEPAGQG